MSYGDVAFLDSGGGIRFHRESQISNFGQLAAAAGHADGCDADSPGFINGPDDVGGVAAGADAPGYVTPAAECQYLFGENIVEVIVIADAGQYRCVGAERYGCQGRALDLKAIDKFSSQMLGIRGTAAVAEDKNFAAVPQTVNQHVCCPYDPVDITFDAIPLGCNAGFQDV